MIPNGLLAQESFAFEQGILRLFALRDVTDIAWMTFSLPAQ
jgi:hypothetical protein